MSDAVEAYCIKCRAKREMKDAKQVTMKNGKTAMVGSCSVCGAKVFKLDVGPVADIPQEPTVYFLKGTLLVSGGKYEEALKEFDKAIEINPNYAEAYNNKGLALFKLGRFKDAIKEIDKAIKLNPNNSAFSDNKDMVIRLSKK